MEKVKRTPAEWEGVCGITVLDPDGWRFTYGNLAPKEYSVPITATEFGMRSSCSTIQIRDVAKFCEVLESESA